MTAGQHELPVISTTRDRAAMLTILSGELAERLAKHPMPPRIIVSSYAEPSRRRWLAWLGLPALAGAAAMAIALPGFPWKPLVEKKVELTGSPPRDVAIAAVPTPGVASAALPPQTTLAPPTVAVDLSDRELTWTEVHELQARLRALKFDPGPLDGIRGPMTSAAVRRFQQSRGAHATGAIDLAVLTQVRQASASGD
jgi:hypothetical protein